MSVDYEYERSHPQMREEVTGRARFAKYGEGEGDLDLITTKVIELATPEELKTMNKEFKVQGDKAVPLKCQDCGSVKISRRSSMETPADAEPDATAFRRSDRGAAALFGNGEDK